MANQISDYFKGYQLTVGRRLLILRSIAAIAEEKGDMVILERSRGAIAEERKTWEIQSLWDRTRGKSEGARPEALALDNRADRAIAGIQRGAFNFVENAPETNPLHKVGRRLLDEFFPDGVGAVTNQSYEDQFPTMERYVAQWTDEWADKIEQLNLSLFVRQLEELLPAYEAALVAPRRRTVSYDQVRAAHADGEDRLASVIALVLGTYGEETPESDKLRRRYMQTYDDQQQRVAAYHRRRRPVPEVDIETGDEIEDTGDFDDFNA